MFVVTFLFKSPWLYRDSGRRTPSSAYPSSYCRFAYSKIICPINAAFGFVVCCYLEISSRISVLSFPINPFAVFSEISTVAIDSINRKSIWAFTHIRKKFFERISPLVTHSNSSAAIVFITSGSCRITPRNNSFPNFMRLCSRLSVRNATGLNVFSVDASTRMCFSSEVATRNNFFCSAVAYTLPKNLAVLISSDNSFYIKPMKLFASKVLEFSHFVTSKFITDINAWRSAVKQIFGSYPSQAIWRIS